MAEIRLIDIQKEYMSIKEEIDIAIRSTIESGRLILGEQVSNFEKEFSSYVGVKYAVGVNSGSDALYLSLRALGIGQGDEVITVSHTFISVVDAIVRSGAHPVLVDVDPFTLNIDTKLIPSKITKRTKAIIPVHMYGNPADMANILEIADSHNVSVIEDASQSHGATINGRKTGSFGILGTFSFYPTKNLGAYGDSGMVTTNSYEMAMKLRELRNYGERKKYEYVTEGINSRMDELQAAILRVKLRRLDKWNSRRRFLASIYSKRLEDSGIGLPSEEKGSVHVYHQYVIRTDRRDEIRDMLRSNGIPTLVHYPIPIHLQHKYSSNFSEFSLPETERASRQILSLPMHPFLSDAEVSEICDRILQLPL